jgi:hypothetical protein
MANITLVLKGADSVLKSKLLKEVGSNTFLDFNELRSMPTDEELLLSGTSSSCQLEDLKREWRLENWGIIEPMLSIDIVKYKLDVVYIRFKVLRSAPVEFISHLSVSYPEMVIYLGYDDPNNPLKCGFVGYRGDIWPWKAEGMLWDVNGDAIYTDKHGDFRSSKTNNIVNQQCVTPSRSLNHFDFLIEKLLF